MTKAREDEAAASCALSLIKNHRLPEAIIQIKKALAISPGRPDYWRVLAQILNKSGESQEEVVSLEKAAALSKDPLDEVAVADSYLNKLGRPDLGVKILVRLLSGGQHIPELQEIYYGLLIRHYLKDHSVQDALQQMKCATREGFSARPALQATCSALLVEGRYEEAESCANVLSAEKGGSCAGLSVLAQVCAEQRHDLAAASTYLSRALLIDANNPQLHAHYVCHLLRTGDYDTAKEHFLRRIQPSPLYQVGPWSVAAKAPMWGGSELQGKSLLIAGSKSATLGFGDFFQLARCASLLSDLGAKAIFQSPGSIGDLMRTLPGNVAVVEEIAELNDVNVCVNIWFSFLHLDNPWRDIKRHIPYLSPDIHLTEKWRNILCAPGKLKVGLVWGSGSSSRNVHTCRNIPLADLSPLFKIPDVVYYGMQVGGAVNARNEKQNDSALIDVSSKLTPFSETAAALMNLDLLVSVDTATAHLGGAVGCKTVVLLPFSPEFRWMLTGDSTPWYPSARVFRQKSPGDWADPIKSLSRLIQCMQRNPGSGLWSNCGDSL